MKDSMELRKAMVKAGYCVSPNNIYGLPGVIMYPAGPLVRCPERLLEIQVDKTIRVFRQEGSGEPYTKDFKWSLKTVAEFTDIVSFLAWCPCISEGGQPANVWD